MKFFHFALQAALAWAVIAACIVTLYASDGRELSKCPVDVDLPESTCGERVDKVKNNWRFTPGNMGIPLGYTYHLMRQSFSKNQSWTEIYCGSGKHHCAGKSGWPGPSDHILGNHDAVTALGKLLPSKSWDGTWWRGNELALWILSPVLYYHTDHHGKPLIDPPAIGLGALPRQHDVTRPMIMRFSNMESWNETKVSQVTVLVESSAQQLVNRCKEQGRLAASDISVWFQQIMHKIIFDVDISAEYASDFASIGKPHVPASLMSYSLPKFLLNRDQFKLKSRQRRVVPYINALRKWLDEKHSDVFEKADCSPSKSCLDQGAFGTFDLLQFAGGLSIPSTLMTSLALLYSTSPNNPARQSATEGFTYAAGEEMQFYWEVIRMFPGVDSVPFWDVRPLCNGLDRDATDALNKPDGQTDACPLGEMDNRTGTPDINSYTGGRRWVLSLILALRDPAVWGPDAHKFRLRSLETYEKNSVSFLEMAKDPSVADGRADRTCPGRSLALLMARSFLKAFNKEEWANSPNSEIGLKGSVPFIKPYALFPKRIIQECMEKTCKCTENMGFISRKMCSWCTSRHCPK